MMGERRRISCDQALIGQCLPLRKIQASLETATNHAKSNIVRTTRHPDGLPFRQNHLGKLHPRSKRCRLLLAISSPRACLFTVKIASGTDLCASETIKPQLCLTRASGTADLEPMAKVPELGALFPISRRMHRGFGAGEGNNDTHMSDRNADEI